MQCSWKSLLCECWISSSHHQGLLLTLVYLFDTELDCVISLHCSSVEMFRTACQSLVLLLTRLSTDWWWWRLEKCAALANTALLLSRIVRCLSRKLRSPPCLVTSLVWIEERTPRLSISSNWQTQNGREKLWDVGGFRVMCESQGMFWRSQPSLILTWHW